MRYGRTGAGVAGRFWGSTAVDSSRRVRADPKADAKAEKAKICLNCTKERCTGTAVCFRKMKIVGVVEDD